MILNHKASPDGAHSRSFTISYYSPTVTSFASSRNSAVTILYLDIFALGVQNLFYRAISRSMSHQMQNIFIKSYEPLPEETIILPVNQLEQFLADAPSKYGVAWVFHIQRDGVTSDGPSTS
ncbi:MAG: hypothetical protein EXX96DRAFT_610290 [Benjaminiella poitrasii]|nr:MAG: hypothetical protein EXX96DRAFT_610290 [Benjaminiella poitrasii]